MALALATDSCCPQITRAMPAKPGSVGADRERPGRLGDGGSRRSRRSRASRCRSSAAAESSRSVKPCEAVLEGGHVVAIQPILRFAPSPNGRLHLGHAYSALFTARWAEQLGGRFLLRIEDIDAARCKPEFTQAIFEDLHWLGLDWPEPVMRQSERFGAYAGFAGRLRQMGLLYPCFCSRTEIAAAAKGTDPDGAPLYPGTCRHLDAPGGGAAAGRRAIRCSGGCTAPRPSPRRAC
jgi:hypothetical protein